MTGRLVCAGESFDVPQKELITLDLFSHRPGLLEHAYNVQCTRNVGIVRQFVKAIGGENIEINGDNAYVLDRLCQEFGYGELQAKVNRYVRSNVTSRTSIDVRELRSKLHDQERKIQALDNELRDVRQGRDGEHQYRIENRKLERLEKELQDLRRTLGDRNDLWRTINGQIDGKIDAMRLSFMSDISDLRSEILALRSQCDGLRDSHSILARTCNDAIAQEMASLRGDLDRLRASIRDDKVEEQLHPTPNPKPKASPVEEKKPQKGFFSRLGGFLSWRKQEPVTESRPRVIDRSKEAVVTLDRSHPLRGIIARLTEMHRGNVHDRRVVVVSGKADKHSDVRSVVDLEDNSYFCSVNEPNQALCFDFREILIKPTAYTIKTSGYNISGHLVSWTVEASNNGRDWTEIDRHQDDNSLTDEDVTASFHVKDCDEWYQMICLRQTGKNNYGQNFLVINAFEVFGEMRQVKPPTRRQTK